MKLKISSVFASTFLSLSEVSFVKSCSAVNDIQLCVFQATSQKWRIVFVVRVVATGLMFAAVN